MNARCVQMGKTNNFCEVNLNGNSYWFSYQTLIAFRVDGRFVVSENARSTTTGKHLNMISDRSQRVPHEEFVRIWEELHRPKTGLRG